ncbi:MAG TPA: GIY-YIG nuclease family protein [Candidatus Tenderia sp.]|nr:GIY-YIG nuclease family protein [Candidatus Tenderia sp.]
MAQTAELPDTSAWLVYILLCSDDSFYTGITNNLERRVAQHAAKTGAKYFRGRQPRKVVYLERGHNRSSASRREAEIKKLSRRAKAELIDSALNQWVG